MQEQPKERNRFYSRIGYFVIALLILFIVLIFLYRYSSRNALARRLDELRKNDYPVTLEELEEQRKLPVGTPNAADLYLAEM